MGGRVSNYGKHRKGKFGKTEKGKLNVANSVCKTKIPIEYREKGVRCFKN